MPYLDIFAIEFSKTIVLFEIATMKFEKFEIWQINQTSLNLHPKMTSFGTFGLEFQKVGAQNFLFEYFWDRIFKNYCLI